MTTKLLEKLQTAKSFFLVILSVKTVQYLSVVGNLLLCEDNKELSYLKICSFCQQIDFKAPSEKTSGAGKCILNVPRAKLGSKQILCVITPINFNSQPQAGALFYVHIIYTDYFFYC